MHHGPDPQQTTQARAAASRAWPTAAPTSDSASFKSASSCLICAAPAVALAASSCAASSATLARNEAADASSRALACNRRASVASALASSASALAEMTSIWDACKTTNTGVGPRGGRWATLRANHGPPGAANATSMRGPGWSNSWAACGSVGCRAFERRGPPVAEPAPQCTVAGPPPSLAGAPQRYPSPGNSRATVEVSGARRQLRAERQGQMRPHCKGRDAAAGQTAHLLGAEPRIVKLSLLCLDAQLQGHLRSTLEFRSEGIGSTHEPRVALIGVVGKASDVR